MSRHTTRLSLRCRQCVRHNIWPSLHHNNTCYDATSGQSVALRFLSPTPKGVCNKATHGTWRVCNVALPFLYRKEGFPTRKRAPARRRPHTVAWSCVEAILWGYAFLRGSVEFFFAKQSSANAPWLLLHGATRLAVAAKVRLNWCAH